MTFAPEVWNGVLRRLRVELPPFAWKAWIENMTAGRGWIALALVVFATWRTWRAFFGAYLFGGITILQLQAQGFGLEVPSQFLSMLPYLVTIVVLVIISSDASRLKLSAPGCIGKPFHAAA